MEEDLQPHLVLRVQVHHRRPGCHIVVPCVSIKRLDAKLAVLHQPDGQVLVGQRDVIWEIIYARVRADKFSRLRVVVVSLVEEDLVELDGRVLCRVAAGDSHREGRFGQQAAALADSRFPWWSSLALIPLLPIAANRAQWAKVSRAAWGASFPCRTPIASTSNLTCWSNPALYTYRQKKNSTNIENSVILDNC